MNQCRLAARRLLKTPVFTATAVLSIALGIGANTAVFALVNEFLLRSLPVRDPHELVLFRAIHGARGRMSGRGEGPGFVDPATGRNSGTPFSLLAYERFTAARAPLSDVFAFAPFSQVHAMIDGVPETTLSAQFVSGSYYSGLGVSARSGRMITADDDRKSSSPVAVISHRFWERRFDSDPRALGATILINRVAATIIGVSSQGFDGALQAGETADVSVPLAHHARFQPDRSDRSEPWYWWVRIMGRLAPGATPAQVAAALEPVFQQAAREGWVARQVREPGGTMPDDPSLAADPGAQGENDVRRQYSRSLKILMGLVGLVLAAACANVASLLAARGHSRRREIAMCLAIGARQRQIAGQLLLESLMLSVAGAVVGVVFAWWGRVWLLSLRPFGNTNVTLDVPLDVRVLGFSLVIALITALLFGLAPALRAAHVDVTMAFQGGARAIRPGRSRLVQTFMVVQVAVSLVLLVSTGLFVRTVNQLQRVDAGFNRHNLVLFRIDATSAGYTPDESIALHARIQEELATLPGVRAATFSRVALLSRTRQNMNVTIPRQTLPQNLSMNVNTNGLASNFFDAMELPLVLGRGFTERDHANAPKVAVVNQTFVRTYFGDANPVGRHLAFNAPDFRRTVEIVGVARDAKYTELRAATPATVYFPAMQQPDGNANFAIRSTTEPAAVFAAIRRVVRDIDPALPVLNLRTQTEQVDRLHGQERLFARLSGFFGITALALACMGLYGLMSDAVLRRYAEIGLRVAVGARPAQILGMIVRESIWIASFGAALGLAAAYGLARFVATMLFGVSPTDPLTYSAVAGLLIGTAALASAVPAWRASRIQPLDALRSE